MAEVWLDYQASYVGFDEEIPWVFHGYSWSECVTNRTRVCDGFILLYSTTSRSSFKEVSRTCRQLPLDAKKDHNLVLVLVGTKSDDKSSREVTPEEGRALADQLGCQAFFETSAKSGENVNNAVSAMVLALRKATKERKLEVVTSFLMIIKLISWFRGGGSRITDAG